MSEKINELLEKFRTTSTKENLIPRLTSVIEWISANYQEEDQEDKKFDAVDIALDFITKNGLDFKYMLPNSNFSFSNYYKNEIKKFYSTLEEELFEKLNAELKNENVETVIKCRYYWRKFRDSHNSSMYELSLLERKLSRCLTIKELDETLKRIVDRLDELLLEQSLSENLYKRFCEQLFEKYNIISNEINSGNQDTKKMISMYKKIIKKNNKN